MPRFKNTGLVPVQTPAGAPVAPGGFCEYDGEPVPGLVEVPSAPDAKPSAPKRGAAPKTADEGAKS